MKIIQAYPEVKFGDAISSIMLNIHEINKGQRWSDTMIAYYSEYPEVKQVGFSDRKPRDLLIKFIERPNKLKNIRAYLNSSKSSTWDYKKALEEADIRIWHMGTTYKLMEHNIRKGDFIFFYGLNYPYLSSSPESIIDSYKALQWLRSLQPKMVVESYSVKNELLRLGWKEEEIKILPLFHKYNQYNLSYIGCQVGSPHLIAWGRYALNKRVPEIAEICSKENLSFTAFGDNSTYVEFADEYSKATKYSSDKIKLYSKLDSIEKENKINAANIYICNSENEGFNMPLIEAEAHSLPVLARRGTAMDELVKDGYNGYLFNDINEVPELINKIMKNYKEMSYNAWKHSQNYTYERFKQNYLKILKEYKRGIK